MPLRVSCPSCHAVLTAPDTSAGKTVKCPKCLSPMALPHPVAEPHPPKPAIARAVVKSIPFAPAIEDDERTRPDRDEEARADEELPRKKGKKKKKRAPKWLAVLGTVFGIALVLIIPGARIAKIILLKNRIDEREAKAQEAAAAGTVGLGTEAAAPPEMPAGLYGDLPSEQPVDPIAAPKDAPLRPRAADPIYQLSNPRFVPNKGGSRISQTLQVDVVRTKDAAKGASSANPVVRTPGGRPQMVTSMPSMFRDDAPRTTIDIEITPFGPNKQVTDVEIFMANYDFRFPNKPMFKCSNSVVVGSMPDTTRARNWTASEVKEFNAGPPVYERSDAPANLGTNTPFVGVPKPGRRTERYVDPTGTLIGVEFQPPPSVPDHSIFFVKPIFRRDQPERAGQSRLMPPDGYAVGAAVVCFKTKGASVGQVSGVRFLFYRIKPDGNLDTTQQLTGDWIGNPSDKASTKTTNSNGRKVIGLEMKGSLYLDGLSLVTE